MQILSGHTDTVAEFIIYQVRLFQTQDAGHGGFFGYHFVVLLFGVFPSSILAIKAFGKEPGNELFYKIAKTWMVILFWVVLILFTIVKTKIIHYSSLAYFPLTFLAAAFVYRAHMRQLKWSKWISAVLIILTTLIALPVILLQFIEKYKYKIIDANLIKDAFTVENLKAETDWTGFEFMPGIIFILAILFILCRYKRNEPLKRALLIWTANILFMSSVIMVFVPKIEMHSQNALITFFKSKANEDVYFKTLFFKSYAPWFYGKTQPPSNINYYNQEWLLTGNIDKDVYFVTKIHRAGLLEEYDEVKEIGRKNGFVFYLREAN
jgi:glucan phosphoethanolaminetransferase (alkaline phosphatase superfamily)